MQHRRFATLAVPFTLFMLAGCTASSPETTASTPNLAPSITATAPVQTPTPTPTPAPAPTPATCENIATTEYLGMMASNDWVSWTADGSPFDTFPSGAPAGHLTCTWGADPNLGTDNVVTVAWTPIDGASAMAAQTHLIAEGYERIEAPEGVYLAMRGEDGWADESGFAQSYLFTDGDARWAMFKDELRFVKAPDEPAA